MDIEKTKRQKEIELYKKLKEKFKNIVIDPVPPMPKEAENWYI